MAVTVKVADCPGITNSCGSGWPVIMEGSTAEGGRNGGREERKEQLMNESKISRLLTD